MIGFNLNRAAQLRELSVSPLNEGRRFSMRRMIVIDQRSQLGNAFPQYKVLNASLLVRSPSL
jgi:hypothetical protein